MPSIHAQLAFLRVVAVWLALVVLAPTAESKWTHWQHPDDKATNVNGWAVHKLSVRYIQAPGSQDKITALHFTASRPNSICSTISRALGVRRSESPFDGTFRVDTDKGRLVLGKPTDMVVWKVYLICLCETNGLGSK